MSIIINWIDTKNKADRYIEVPLFEESFIIHCSNDVITKTEWSLAVLNKSVAENDQWKDLQQCLTDSAETLKISLKKQGSVFRNRVWAEMCKIPLGQTVTYSALAKKIESGARAVANACRDNPFPVIIPCHRVVAISGLGGYMGQTGGRALDIKRKLLAAETERVNNEKYLPGKC